MICLKVWEIAVWRKPNCKNDETEKSNDKDVQFLHLYVSEVANSNTSKNQDSTEQPWLGVQVLGEAWWVDFTTSSIVESFEFESAFVRVLIEWKFVIAKSLSFRFIAHNIERNIPTSAATAESSFWVVRRLLCNEVNAGNITIFISEDINWAEAVLTRRESRSTLKLDVISIGIAEVDQRSLLLIRFIL
jgi:hypothetical protein